MSQSSSRFEQDGNARRLVLAVAVHGDQRVVAVGTGEGERRDQGRAVAAIAVVIDAMDARFGREEVAGTIGRAVIDHEDFRAGTPSRGDDRAGVVRLVVDRNGGEDSHDRSRPRMVTRIGEAVPLLGSGKAGANEMPAVEEDTGPREGAFK